MRSRWSSTNALWILGAVTAFAAALRFWGIGFGLPFTFARPDEDVVIARAARMWTEGPNPHEFDWPTLFIYFIAAAIRVYFAIGQAIGRIAAGSDLMAFVRAHAAQIYLLDRVIVALLGAATVPLLYWAVRRLFSREVALVAALFLSVAFLHVRDSHFGVTDVPATFMVILAFGFLATRPMDWRHPWTVFGAAVLGGLAASTKYNAALIVVPLLVRAGVREWQANRNARTVATLFALIAVGAGCGFLAGTPFALFDSRAFRIDVLSQSAHLAKGHGITLGLGWRRHLTLSLWYGIGWPMLLAAAAGIVIALVASPVEAVVAAAFPLLYYAVIGSGQTVFARYIVPMIPFMCLMAAIAVTAIPRLVGSRRGGDALGLTLAGVVTLAIAVPNIGRAIAFDQFVSKTDNRVVAARWLEQGFPSGAVVYQVGQPYAQLQLPPAFVTWTYDPAIDVLKAEPSRLPRLVIAPMSPLIVYTSMSELATRALQARYRRLMTFDVENPAARGEPRVYDLQDAFFAPLSGFAGLDRPGPAIEIFERMDP